jgi:hypothetical protein
MLRGEEREGGGVVGFAGVDVLRSITYFKPLDWNTQTRKFGPQGAN